MKILFVRPQPSPETIGLQHVMVVEPLEFEVLGALIRPEDSAVILDMILEDKPFMFHLRRQDPDLVCVTGYITHVRIIIEYCRIAKAWNPRIRTVVGGVHCEVCPEDLQDDAVDFRVVRNAATVFPKLLDHLRGKGDLPPGILPHRERLNPEELPPLDFTFPIPDRSLTERYRDEYFYIFHDRVALLKTSFGCPYTCNFCFCRAITGGAYAERPLDEVMAELEGIREREIYIVDDDFLVNRNRLTAFIEANRLRHLDKHYLVYGRADFIARNPDLMRSFRDAGLRTVIVGFESFSDDELRQYDKGIDARTNREAMSVLRGLGIDCYATVIIPPQWEEKDFAECGRTLVSLGIHYVNLQPLTPLPGTGFPAEQHDLLVPPADYPRWDLAHVVIRPHHLSVAGFYRAIINLYNDILFQPKVLWGYLRRYRIGQLWKLARGTLAVRRQYLRKIREASHEPPGARAHA